MIESAAQPLWRRFPVAAQRLRAALLDATFPRVVEAEAQITSAGDESWRVRVLLPVDRVVGEEMFSGEELRAYRGRWNEWTDALAARIAAEPT